MLTAGTAYRLTVTGNFPYKCFSRTIRAGSRKKPSEGKSSCVCGKPCDFVDTRFGVRQTGKTVRTSVAALEVEKTGTHRYDRNTISNLDGSMDIFLNAYLKANQGSAKEQ